MLAILTFIFSQHLDQVIEKFIIFLVYISFIILKIFDRQIFYMKYH